jgi:hypothetical protein
MVSLSFNKGGASLVLSCNVFAFLLSLLIFGAPQIALVDAAPSLDINELEKLKGSGGGSLAVCDGTPPTLEYKVILSLTSPQRL